MRISVSWLAFTISKLQIYFNICFLSTFEKVKWDSCCLLHTSPIMSMLRWFLYFIMDLKTESLSLSEIGSQWVYSAILTLLTILGKKLFRFCAELISLSTISPFSVKVSFSFDPILSDNSSLMISQNIFHQ